MEYKWAKEEKGNIHIGIEREYLDELADALEGQGFWRRSTRGEPVEIFDYEKSDPEAYITLHYMVDDEVAIIPNTESNVDAEEYADAVIHGHKVGEKMLPELYNEAKEELE
jgi:hypothetical protein